MSFKDLLDTFIDEMNGRRLTPEEMTLRKDLLARRVDERCEEREAKRALLAMHQKRVDDLEEEIAKAEAEDIELLRRAEFEKLPGRMYSLVLSESTSTRPLKEAPEQSDIERYPQFVRIKDIPASRTVEWNKAEMLPFLRAGNTLPFAVLKHSYKSEFKPRSEK